MRVRVYLDGQVVPPEEARVSVFDRGFLYGDGCYEVLRTYGGVPFALDEHLERFVRSGELLAIEDFPSEAALRKALSLTLNAFGSEDAYLRLMVTRGQGPLSLDPDMAENPRLIIIAKDVVVPPARAYAEGIEVAIVDVVRNPASALDPSAKSGNYLNNILALREARQRGADEALMRNMEGQISEGASSNFFAMVDGSLCTPPLEAGILAGITRQILLEEASEAGLQTREEALWPADIERADEAFITSSIREVLPVTRCNGQPVGSGCPGSITRMLWERYRERVQRVTGHRQT